jgi:hypothetical protein
MDSTATDPTTQPGPDPAEGRPDMDLPGADRDGRPDPDREDELPIRLGERIDDRPREGGPIDEPDLLPNVEIPEEQM